MEMADLLNRIRQAISVFHTHHTSSDFLIQCWLPEEYDTDGGCILRCRTHPLMLVGMRGDELLAYRRVSENREYRLAGPPVRVPDESKGVVGRCFLSGRPEISPNLHRYTPAEFPQLASVVECGVKAMFVLPLFCAAPGGATIPMCKGVLEVVYRDARWSVVNELNQMAESLDHVGLFVVKSDPLRFDPNLHFPVPQLEEGVQRLVTALQEECGPLLCRVWSKVTARRNGLLSTKLTAKHMPFAVVPLARDMVNFHSSCCATMLELDEGPPGLALTSGKQYGLMPDCSNVHVSTYPLALLARAAKLRGVVAFVLSLKDAPGHHATKTPLCVLEVFLRRELVPAGRATPQLLEVGRLATAARHIITRLGLPLELPDIPHQPPARNTTATHPVNPTNTFPPVLQEGELPSAGPSAPLVYRKAGTGGERIIEKHVLEDHFMYSLKEAAARIGVCPTTLKKNCRTHGIARWPLRGKLNRCTLAAPETAVEPEPSRHFTPAHGEARHMETEHGGMGMDAQGFAVDAVKPEWDVDAVKMEWGTSPLSMEPTIPLTFDLSGAFQPPQNGAVTSPLDVHFSGGHGHATDAIAIGGEESGLLASALGMLSEPAHAAGKAEELGLGAAAALDDVWARGFDAPLSYGMMDSMHVHRHTSGPLAASVAIDDARAAGGSSDGKRARLGRSNSFALPSHFKSHPSMGHLHDPTAAGGSLPSTPSHGKRMYRHLDDHTDAIGGSMPGGVMFNPSVLSRLQHAGGSLPGVHMHSTPLWADPTTSELAQDFQLTLVETEGSGISNIDPFALQGDDWISNFNNLSSAHLPVTPFASEPFTNPFTSPFAPGSANVVPSKIDEMLQDDGHRMLQYTVTVKAVLNNVPARFKLRDQAGHEGLRQDLAKHYKVEEGAHVTAQWLNGNNEAVCDVDSDQALRTCVQRAFASAAPGSRSCVMRLNVVCASPNADCRPAAQWSAARAVPIRSEDRA